MRKRILIFEPYPVNQVGGNLRTLSYILKFVDKTKYHLIIVVPVETDLLKGFREEGVECVVVSAPPRVNRYGGQCLKDSFWSRVLSVWDMLLYNLQLYRMVKNKRIDLIYCNCIRAVLSIGLAARLSRRPVLWYVKGELQNGFLDRLGFILANKILFFCETNRDDRYPRLVSWYKKKIDVLKIGIDSETVTRAEQSDKSEIINELHVDKGKINLIVLAQLYPPKGIHFVLEALGRLVGECPHVMLYVVGDHVIEEYKFYRQDLDRIIEQRGLMNYVTFTGWRKDALEILSLMDILVHPSLAEGFGRAVLEAMAFGKPVIASKVGGLREIIRDGENGFLVEPGNVEMITKRLGLLIKNKALRDQLGQAAKREVFSGYLIQDKMLRLEQIWGEMASKKKEGQ